MGKINHSAFWRNGAVAVIENARRHPAPPAKYNKK